MIGEVRISVVICTHNRAGYLRKALAALAAQTLDPAQYEVLVIDNGSHDDTAQAVAEFADSASPPRYLAEPRLGLSIARNTGWRAATGTHVAYLDDDAVPEPDWAANAHDELCNAPDDLGMLGGRVIPIWECARPDWLGEALLPYLTMIDLGDGRMLVDSTTGIVGANMIVPRVLLERVGGFSEQLGRKGKSLLSNEELHLKEALCAIGFRGYYRGDVAVGHHVPPARVSRRWFMARLYWQGRSDVQWYRMKHPLPKIRRLRSVRRELAEAIRYWREGICEGGNTAAGFDLLTKSSYHFGRAIGEIAS